MAAPLITRVDDAAAVAETAADLFARAAREAVDARGRFAVALAGGATPRATYQRLAARTARGTPVHDIAWSSVHVFWGDERCVSPDHPDSNYRMARTALLDRVPIPPAHVHRIESELADPHEAAARYERTLRNIVVLGGAGMPCLDLVLLGVGPDAHTASLFPGTALLEERDRLVAADWIPRLSTWRITMTLPVLTVARLVVFIVAGAEKADAVAEVFGAAPRGSPPPARVVATRAEHVAAILDRAAAGQLQG